MQANSFISLIPLLVVGLLFVPPYWKIFGRSDWHPASSFLMVIPFVNLVLLWLVAFKKWPRDDFAGTFR